MFDFNLRLIVCNQRYLDMYGLSRDVVRPGATLQKIVKHRAAVGSFGTDKRRARKMEECVTSDRTLHAIVV